MNQPVLRSRRLDMSVITLAYAPINHNSQGALVVTAAPSRRHKDCWCNYREGLITLVLVVDQTGNGNLGGCETWIVVAVRKKAKRQG
jgi:hypothetical protein